LAQPHVRRQGPYFGQHSQRFALHFAHGSRSPIFGSSANALGSLPITSTRIKVPGASFAMRVARVTPLYSISTPSVPSYTHGGGIPTADRPNKAICLASLAGSAPWRRDGGTRNSRESTSRKSGIRSL